MKTNSLGNGAATRQLGWASVFLMTLFVAAGCGGGGGNGGGGGAGSPVTGTVSGKVVSAATGAAVSGATIRAGSATVTSAADGAYTLTQDPGDRVIIHLEAAGFAETFQIARVVVGKTASLDVQLLPIGAAEVVNVAAGGTVIVPGSSAQVSIPAGALIPALGGAPAAIVNVAVTPINPAIDADIMPGDYTAVLSGSGSPVPIESFGALLIDIRDDSGVRYTLTTGQTASIRIPVGTLSTSPPPSIPMLIFDESTGLWVEEGTATLAGTAPDQYYAGTVQRFGFWNADQAMNTVFVTGCVRDTANQPVVNVRVKSDGINYSGSTSTFTDADGNFRVAVRRDGLATLSVTFSDGSGKPLTTTINVGPFTADSTLPDCIVTEPAPLQMIARSLPAGIVGTAYNARLAASNGTKPYSWSVTSGALPTGLTLDSVTGQISGTPTAAGTFTGTIQAQDSSTPQQSASASFSITISTVSPPPPPPGDTTAPTILSTSPADSATGVAINTAITATFSEPMTASTITPATFTIFGGVTGAVIYSGTTATFTPTSNLANNTTYTATITTGVKDAAGNALASNHTWSFTTQSATAAGALDITFNSTGKVVTTIGPSIAVANAVAVQSDGKIVAVGQSLGGGGAALARYNTDGSIDTTFGTSGIVMATSMEGVFGAAVAIQSDDKIVVAGTSSVGGFALARYNTSGSLDTTFGTGGKVTTANNGSAKAVAIQSADGKIVVAGFLFGGGGLALARYDTNGSLDTAFGTGGQVIAPGLGDTTNAVAIQSDNKIVVAGSSGFAFALARYNANGSLDTTFDADGKVTTDIGTGIDIANAVAIQADGKIVAAGQSPHGAGVAFALVRYNANGSLDTDFGTGGKVTTDFDKSLNIAQAIAIQSDRKIVAAGWTNDSVVNVFALARYNTDGSLDTTFDADGKVTTAIGIVNMVNAVAIQSDGKIVAAGRSDNAFALARYLP